MVKLWIGKAIQEFQIKAIDNHTTIDFNIHTPIATITMLSVSKLSKFKRKEGSPIAYMTSHGSNLKRLKSLKES